SILQCCGIEIRRGKAFKAAPARSIHGRMDGAGTPFNEEWQHPVPIVRKNQRFPAENASVGPGTRAWPRALSRDAGIMQFLGQSINFTRMCGPADKARISQPLD